MTLRLTTHGPEQTEALAGAIAALLRPGDVIRLTGGIGSGKTAFARGVARQLGVTEPVVSPTFLLQCIYEGRLTLHHFDLYRLGAESEALELGIDEFADDGVVLVEWADRFPDAIAPPHLTIAFELGAADDERHLTLTPEGEAWEERAARLGELAGRSA